MATFTVRAMARTQQLWARLFSMEAWDVELATSWYATSLDGACLAHLSWLWQPLISVLPIGRYPTTTAGGATLLSTTSTWLSLPSSSSPSPLLELFLSSTRGNVNSHPQLRALRWFLPLWENCLTLTSRIDYKQTQGIIVQHKGSCNFPKEPHHREESSI